LTHTVDGFNRERIEVIKEAARQVQADIILPAGLPSIRMVAEHRRELETVAHLPPLAPIEMLDRFADKALFAELLEQESISYPKIRRLHEAALQEEYIADIKFPVLVKPRNLEAGSGIRLCENPQQIADYLAAQPDPHNFFVQEFIKGSDVGCSVISKDGEVLAYTIQRGIVSSHKPFNPPAAVEFIRHRGVIDSIQKLVRATHWSGVVNFDLILDAKTDEPKMLEANPRYWRSLLGSLVAGVNFPYIACLASEGGSIPRPEYQKVCYAKPNVALGLLFKSWVGDVSSRISFAESGLSYLARDPFPDLAIQLQRLMLTCRRKFHSQL
jgi:predicted ATP-grasp superfamily ATP-dependent carboligase